MYIVNKSAATWLWRKTEKTRRRMRAVVQDMNAKHDAMRNRLKDGC